MIIKLQGGLTPIVTVPLRSEVAVANVIAIPGTPGTPGPPGPPGGSGDVIVSDTAPLNPKVGDLWVKPDTAG